MTYFSPTMPSTRPAPTVSADPTKPARWRTLLLGTDPADRWSRPALIALLVATAVAYTWNLHVAGWANSFYSAAVQASSESWKAWFFSSADASNFTTVDKPPASIWVMGLSARLFGFSTLSMLVPQVLLGVGSVALLCGAVRRWFGPKAGLLAGFALAVTPVAAMMFRFNNPDALLVFLEVLGAYFVTRAVEQGRTRWLALAGVAIGFAFLAKSLQAFLVVPAFALAYMVAAPVSFGKRVVQLAVAGAAMVAAGGWWVLVVSLWPASSRPYFGGSTDNSFLSLVFGYNGVSRITGGEGNGGGGGGGANFSGTTGVFRLFNNLMGGEASWLLPAAIVALIAGLVFAGRAARTNRARAAILLWGGWLFVTAFVFSFASGTIHTYYTVALAPAIAALVGIVGTRVWSQRDDIVHRVLLGGTVVLTSAWSFVLLNRYPDWHGWLRVVVTAAAVIAMLGLMIEPFLGRSRRSVGRGLAVALLVAVLAGPFSYTASNLSTGETGSIPTSGPITSGMGGGFGDAESSSIDAQVVAMLQSDAASYRWVAAAMGSNASAPLQLASGDPVMSIGGFNGSDEDITLAQFQAYVAAGDIHYFVAGGMGGFGGRGGSSTEISRWVSEHFTATTVGFTTLYDLTQPATA